MNDAELDDVYRHAGALDPARPSPAVRRRILARATNIARARKSSGAKGARSQWRVVVPLAAAILAVAILVPMRNGPVQPRSFALPRATDRPVAGVQRAPAPAQPPSPIEVAPGSAGSGAIAPAPRSAPPPAAHEGPRIERDENAVVGSMTASDSAVNARTAVSSRQSSSMAVQAPAISVQEAAKRGDTAQLAALLREDAGLLEARDLEGRTPLLLATMNRHLDAVAWLLAHGADPNATDRAGRTPLQIADELGDAPISAGLRRAGGR
jgi:hypothetical protein